MSDKKKVKHDANAAMMPNLVTIEPMLYSKMIGRVKSTIAATLVNKRTVITTRSAVIYIKCLSVDFMASC